MSYTDYIRYENGDMSVTLRHFANGKTVAFVHEDIKLRARKEYTRLVDGWNEVKQVIRGK